MMQKHLKLILVLFFGLQLLFLSQLKHFPEFVEQFYSNGIYVYCAKAMRYAFGWAPFSIGDLFYTLASIAIIRWLIKNRKKPFTATKTWLLDIGATLSLVYFAFHCFWGFNYYRQPLYKSLELNPDYSTEQLLAFTERLIQKSNGIHTQLVNNDTLKIEMPYTKPKILNKVKDGYQNLAQDYPQLNYEPVSIKKSIYSLPLTYMGFSGYLNPLTNEAQVNGLIPTYKYPTTSCHEAAHQLGFAAENEANFIGSLAAIHNDDLYFKYSGYTFALRYCLAEIFKRNPDRYNSLLPTLHPGILKNYQETQTFWRSYENPIEPIFESTFDNFLKANNQSDGMKSYSYVVALLVNYYENRTL